jgi:hemerythrin superfamily protein
MTHHTHDAATSVVAKIREQHELIRELFAGVRNAEPAGRAEAFQPLVRLLAVHETAEEEIVYPDVRPQGAAAEAAVEARLAEEDAAKKTLAELEGMDASSAAFTQALAMFENDVLAHASSEEAEILPLLEQHDAERLETMGTLFTAAEAIAPTHAHRMAPESAIGNMLVGPFVAIVDRVRDAIRDARK